MPSKIQSQMFRTVKSVKHARSKRIVQNGENQWSGMYYGAPVRGCAYNRLQGNGSTCPGACGSCPCLLVRVNGITQAACYSCCS